MRAQGAWRKAGVAADVAAPLPVQDDLRGAHIVGLGNLYNHSLFQQTATGCASAKGTVCLESDAVLRAECRELGLRLLGIVLHLVDGWKEQPRVLNRLDVFDVPIGHTDGLCLTGLPNVEHRAPRDEPASGLVIAVATELTLSI